jgi:uncharacterized hydrophobic protein (TIGR00271 family)
MENEIKEAPEEQTMEEIKPGKLKVFFNKNFVELFDLQSDTDEDGTIDSLKRGVEFKGANLWSLVFAIFIASIGLNTNSTAVIIGAMLISPLMGPIMGTGLAVGIYDFQLLKKSLRNLAIATGVSVFTSYLYFTITPLNEAQSELLARTTPTIYDVLIAIFGGSAGIMAGSRKEKTNVIPGVAIATALMPPLCTAGFGLATGNIRFFLGAFYLFSINSIFICISTIVFVRFLKFKTVSWVDKSVERKVKIYITVFSLLTIMPSIFMAWGVIQESLFKAKAERYVNENFIFPNSKVLNTNYKRTPLGSTIEVSIIGEPLSDEIIKLTESKLAVYQLENTKLKINQSRSYMPEKTEKKDINTDILTKIYSKNEEIIKSKDDRIKVLENELLAFKNKEILIPKLTKEISFLFPTIESFSFGDLLVTKIENFSSIKDPSVIVKWKGRVTDADRKRLEMYLKSRLDIEDLKIIEEK